MAMNAVLATPTGSIVAIASRLGNGGCLAELWGRAGDLVPAPLQPGDEVKITTIQGDFTYIVRETIIVRPSREISASYS